MPQPAPAPRFSRTPGRGPAPGAVAGPAHRRGARRLGLRRRRHREAQGRQSHRVTSRDDVAPLAHRRRRHRDRALHERARRRKRGDAEAPSRPAHVWRQDAGASLPRRCGRERTYVHLRQRNDHEHRVVSRRNPAGSRGIDGDSSPTTADLYVTDAPGVAGASHFHELTTNGADGTEDRLPAWSPDSRSIAFTRESGPKGARNSAIVRMPRRRLRPPRDREPAGGRRSSGLRLLAELLGRREVHRVRASTRIGNHRSCRRRARREGPDADTQRRERGRRI